MSTEKSIHEAKNPILNKGAVISRLYYFDQNRRIYELNSVKKSSPFYEGYFIPIEVISENEKEIICKYGIVKKKTMEYHISRSKFKVFTEQQKNDEVYVKENLCLIAKQVRTLSADKLRMVEAVLNGL